ncbi:glycosyltransferase [Deinococcus maricopensis]|uniref:glycosyltransferase n=1 Tax=Deinococcus maricopensis TaxID=309887 RepID=UPI0005C16EF2|nr:glycosyltransferase [Deinococcus maricopensis]
MRIGLVSTTYLPSRNGVATSTALLARGLRDAGHDVRVFAPAHPAQVAGAPEPGVYRLPSTTWGTPPDYPLMLVPSVAIEAKLPWRDVDVLHTMHPFLAGQLAVRWAYRARVPLAFTAHTQYEEYTHYARMPRRMSRALVRAHVGAFARRVDEVLVPGRAMEDMLRSYGVDGRITRFPNPVDLQAFRQALRVDRAAWGVPAGVPLAVYLGRLAPEKNLEVLLDAVTRARRTQPDLHLLVVGDGPSRRDLAANAPDGVHFAGPVPYARVPEALSLADAFVTASTSEVLPMSMIEALAAGAPLVAARSPAALDLIQEGVNGTVREATPAALAEGLLHTLHPDRLPALRDGARASAAPYDVHTRARALADLYAGMIERYRARRR